MLTEDLLDSILINPALEEEVDELRVLSAFISPLLIYEHLGLEQLKGRNFKINLTIESNNLIVSDNLGYLYSIDLESGKLIWAKNYGIPFRSNIKTDDGYLLDRKSVV